MPRQFRSRPDLNLDRMFETRSEAWERVGLSVEVNEREVRRARHQAMVLVPALIAVYVGYNLVYNGGKWTALGHGWASHLKTPITIAAVLAVMGLGWALARAIGKSAGPTFMRRMDPATAGTFGFLIRLVTIAVALVVALN